MENSTDELAVVPSNQSSALVEIEKQKNLGMVMAMMAVAKKFPRDEALAISNINRACQRASLAGISQYTYSRGGAEITGASVHLLRAIAVAWGNIQSGWQEVERRPGESTVKAFAIDLQTNTHADRSFIVRHWRDTKSGGYLIRDERDIYELLANQAARRVRACLQEVIPQDVVELAVEECDKTLARGGGVPLADRIRSMVAKFSELGVTKDQIESKLGHNIEATKEVEVAKLGKVFQSIRDGVGTVEEHFPSVAQTVADAAPKRRAKAASVAAEYLPQEEPKPEPVVPDPAPVEVLKPVQDQRKTVQQQISDYIISDVGATFVLMKKELVELGWNTDKAFTGMAQWGGFDDIPDVAANKIWNARRGLGVRLMGGDK